MHLLSFKLAALKTSPCRGRRLRNKLLNKKKLQHNRSSTAQLNVWMFKLKFSANKFLSMSKRRWKRTATTWVAFLKQKN